MLRQAQNFLSSTPALARAFAAFAQDEAINYGLINAREISAGDAREIGSPGEQRALSSGPAEPINVAHGEPAKVEVSTAEPEDNEQFDAWIAAEDEKNASERSS